MADLQAGGSPGSPGPGRRLSPDSPGDLAHQRGSGQALGRSCGRNGRAAPLHGSGPGEKHANGPGPGPDGQLSDVTTTGFYLSISSHSDTPVPASKGGDRDCQAL